MEWSCFYFWSFTLTLVFEGSTCFSISLWCLLISRHIFFLSKNVYNKTSRMPVKVAFTKDDCILALTGRTCRSISQMTGQQAKIVRTTVNLFWILSREIKIKTHLVGENCIEQKYYRTSTGYILDTWADYFRWVFALEIF